MRQKCVNRNIQLSGPSGNFPNCLKTFHTVWTFSSLSGNFQDRLESFQTVRKLFRQSGNFQHLFNLQLMFGLHFLGNFVDTRENFPDAQKLSGWQCQRADDVFGTLVLHWNKFLHIC